MDVFVRKNLMYKGRVHFQLVSQGEDVTVVVVVTMARWELFFNGENDIMQERVGILIQRFNTLQNSTFFTKKVRRV